MADRHQNLSALPSLDEVDGEAAVYLSAAMTYVSYLRFLRFQKFFTVVFLISLLLGGSSAIGLHLRLALICVKIDIG